MAPLKILNAARQASQDSLRELSDRAVSRDQFPWLFQDLGIRRTRKLRLRSILSAVAIDPPTVLTAIPSVSRGSRLAAILTLRLARTAVRKEEQDEAGRFIDPSIRPVARGASPTAITPVLIRLIYRFVNAIGT